MARRLFAVAGSMLAGSIQAQELPLHGTYRGRVPHVDGLLPSMSETVQTVTHEACVPHFSSMMAVQSSGGLR